MATKPEHDPVKPERTRTSSTLVFAVIAVVFLVLLIVFIAQNNRKEPLKFLTFSGNVSEAVAIVGSALAGAVLVLAIGLARVIQLRVGTRRHNKTMAKQDKLAAKQAKAGGPAPAAPTAAPTSAPAEPSPEPIETEQ